MLLKNDTQIYRVLKSQADKSLIIDCIKRTMPKWVSTSTLSEFEECTEMLMYETTNYPYTRQLSVDEQRIAQERFTLIAGILPFIGDEQKRSQMICFLADQCSKQTLRRYICLYLVYQDVHCLAPQPKREKSLSPDEQNMQWGLNKFYYTRQKQTLTAAYTMMLKAKYTDKDGKLLPEYPSFTQFRYFFRKTRDKKKECITRNGLKNYQRNNRPLLGDGVREYAPAVGVGMIDSTIADVFLVDDGGKLIGRPIITACVDAFSGLCLGYSIGWEGGVYSLKGLMLNIISDKKSWCQERGVFIDSEQWPCQQLPGTFCCDRGSEYISENFSNPLLLDKEGTSQYLCVSEEKLDSGYDKIMNVILKQTMLQIQSRTTTGTYPQTQLYYDEFQKLSESCQSQRQTISSFLKTSRSKHASVVLCVQNLDNWKKDTIYDILSNIHFLYVLASNNANSLTSEIVCKMAGSYYEKEKSYSQSDRASISTSFKEKQILRPEDLNQLGNDGVLLITNHGYVRTNKLGSAYFSVQPFKSQYEAINAVNKEVMKDM